MKPTGALVLVSGGQDSTTCLYWALARFGREGVESLTFDYGQRHRVELSCAARVAAQSHTGGACGGACGRPDPASAVRTVALALAMHAPRPAGDGGQSDRWHRPTDRVLCALAAPSRSAQPRRRAPHTGHVGCRRPRQRGHRFVFLPNRAAPARRTRRARPPRPRLAPLPSPGDPAVAAPATCRTGQGHMSKACRGASVRRPCDFPAAPSFRTRVARRLPRPPPRCDLVLQAAVGQQPCGLSTHAPAPMTFSLAATA